MPSSHSSPPGRRHQPRRWRSTALVVALVGLWGPFAMEASGAAQTGAASPGSSTTTSTVAGIGAGSGAGLGAGFGAGPLDPSTTLPAPATTVAPSTTTTLPPAWAATVPGPPPVPSVNASAADIARANGLERQIVTQSGVLDVLAAQYDLAQQKVAATAAQLNEDQTRLAAATASADGAQSKVTGAGHTLRQVAVDAYVSLGSGGPSGAGALLATYERGAAQADAETAMGKALSELQQLHQAESQLRAAETTIVNEAQRASDANVAAHAAATQAQGAAQAATVQQQQLLNTVTQVSGNLVPLVAAAQAAEAQAAFTRFRTAGGLDFQAPAGLAGPTPQATAAVQLAMAQLGKPYVWGAAGPSSFDCSGLVQWAWAQLRVAVPRVAADQQAWATPVPISQLAPGDLVFFGNPAHHVGLYVGGGLMVDAPHSGATVSVVPIWWDDLAGFGRVH